LAPNSIRLFGTKYRARELSECRRAELACAVEFAHAVVAREIGHGLSVLFAQLVADALEFGAYVVLVGRLRQLSQRGEAGGAQ
jgi:hypothetical protein